MKNSSPLLSDPSREKLDRSKIFTGGAVDLPPPEASEGDADAVHLSDHDLQDKIKRLSNLITTGGTDKLPDRGDKIFSIYHQLTDDLDRRKLARIQKGVGECQRATQTIDRYKECCPVITSTEANSQGKLVHETDVASSKKLNLSGQNNSHKSSRENGSSLQEKGQPLQESPQMVCLPKKNKQKFSNQVTDVGCPIISSPHAEASLSRRLSKRRRTSRKQGSKNLEVEEVPHVVLLDDEDVPIHSMQPGDPSNNWEEQNIFYPSRGDPDCVELSYSDLKCLEPESYLSSPVMNFYIQYLQQLPSLVKRKDDIYIFNTYFYSKLQEAMMCKDDKTTTFLKLRRWWKGIDIFRKAYFFLPIHGDMHWSLVIICIPAKEDASGLIILHLDSLGVHASSQIFSIVASYLKEEWNYINQNAPHRDIPISKSIWKNLPRRIEKEKITVPQQKNEFDCGLFVLYFMQRFIEQAPERLRKRDLSMFGRKWFRPEEASRLRKTVKDVLTKVFENNMAHGIQEPSAPSSVSENVEEKYSKK